jgi:hypothetical protein
MQGLSLASAAPHPHIPPSEAFADCPPAPYRCSPKPSFFHGRMETTHSSTITPDNLFMFIFWFRSELSFLMVRHPFLTSSLTSLYDMLFP